MEKPGEKSFFKQAKDMNHHMKKDTQVHWWCNSEKEATLK
jgi:hypothetical protein